MSVLIAASLLLAATPASHAENVEVWDPWGDAVSFGDPAPRHSADLRRAALRHVDDAVVVRARYRGPFVWLIEFRFDVNVKGRSNYVAVWAEDSAGEMPRDIDVFRRRDLPNEQRRPLCSPSVRFLDRHRVMTFRVPRSCLGDPRRVRMYVDNFDIDQDHPVDKTRWTPFASRD